MEKVGKIPYVIEVVMYIGFKIILLLGSINKLFFNPKVAGIHYRTKFNDLLDVFQEIYFYYVYRRVSDCSHFPISSGPGVKILVNERETQDYGWTFRTTGQQYECINFGSFNYLGLVEDDEAVAENICDIIDKNGLSTCSSSSTIGLLPIHSELEKLTAEFLQMEDSITFSAGFATNSLNLPSILSRDCLVLSDEKNHASMILGVRLSEAKVLRYRHNDTNDLERKIIENLRLNQLNGGLLFTKIFILTEGIYSMDGTIVDLPKIVKLRNMYKTYLFIDDAHGVGVLGKWGRGICDYHNIDTSNIDLLMGTYSKAFASNGGYIAGKKNVIDFLRLNSYACYGATMPPAAVQKAIMSVKILMSYDRELEGNLLVRKLHEKTYYLRHKFKDEGLNVCGDAHSHIIPWIVGSVSAVSFSIRELRKRNIAVAGVIYPATPLLAARLRFNVCANHTTSQLNQVAGAVKEITYLYGLDYGIKNNHRCCRLS